MPALLITKNSSFVAGTPLLLTLPAAGQDHQQGRLPARLPCASPQLVSPSACFSCRRRCGCSHWVLCRAISIGPCSQAQPARLHPACNLHTADEPTHKRTRRIAAGLAEDPAAGAGGSGAAQAAAAPKSKGKGRTPPAAAAAADAGGGASRDQQDRKGKGKAPAAAKGKGKAPKPARGGSGGRAGGGG